MSSVLRPVISTAKRGMQRLYEASSAEYRRQLLASVPQGADLTLLDVGCDDGAWTDEVRRAMGIAPGQVSGIEAVDARARTARERGFEVRDGDLEARWLYESGSFDVVHANQVIEHVKRLDHFVEELKRVLRPGGTAIVCTENLASWHNVGALALGLMPFSLTNISRTGPIGNPFALHIGEAPQNETWQHIHVVTQVGLRSIFEAHGFTVAEAFAAGYYPAAGRAARALAARDPRHAHFIGLAATSPASPLDSAS